MGAMKYDKAIIDAETTGFNKPGVIQLAIILTNKEDLIVGYYNRFFLNDRPIEQDAIDKSHGLTPEILRELTDVYFKDNAAFVKDLLDSCETIYAHNTQFDISQVLNPSMVANGLLPIDINKTICTMKQYNKICKLPCKKEEDTAKGKFKNPKLVEAIKYLNDCGKINLEEVKKQFNNSFECDGTDHDALYDAYLCHILVKNAK